MRSGNLASTIVYNPQLNLSEMREVMEVKICPMQQLSYICKSEIPHSSLRSLQYRLLSLS